MTSLGYRLNPRFAIKECSSCGALYTGDFCYSKGNVEDKILVPKPPKNHARCAKCGHPVNGPYCQGCALLREKLEEDLKKEQKRIEEEQAAKAQNQKLLICYDDDNDEEEFNSLKDNIISELSPCSAVTPSEPIDSLSMGDEHLDTISATESDEFIKSYVENLVPNPSESEGENGCDVPSCFKTFYNILFDADDESGSSDYQSCSDEDFPKEIYSNPLFEEEIISIKKNQHHFNAESDLVESVLNRDSSIISSSSKIDSLLDEFAELDEFIKSSVENLVPNPSESEGENECDVPACEDFTTFSNILFDADYDFSSSDDQSFSDEDIPKKIYSNPLFDKKIISMKIDPHHFNAESDLIESFLNRDSLIISSSSKIDSLFDEFAVEENEVTRSNEYSKLSATKAIQADCDVKATNIILQGLPPKVYALVSTHKVAKNYGKEFKCSGKERH
nr:hypothetical protein [Tanacetum cinerariifolium]